MITKISENIFEWMGWCPNATSVRTASTVLVVAPESIQSAQPEGGSRGSGKINRGITFALSGTKTLVRNTQLLWFSILTGLVMVFMFIAQYGLRLLATYPYDAIDFPRWVVLTFAIELASVFCLTVLLAGLFLSLSSGDAGRPASFREGLSRAKAYLRPLADWSVIVALLGTAIFVPLNYFGYTPFSLYPLLDLFPFNFVLLPEFYSIGPIGGTYAMLSAVTSIVVVSGINIGLFILTLFVVPLLVLENRRLHEAVTGSVTLMKNVWGELLSCFLILVLVISAVTMTSLLFRVVYGVVAPDMLLFWYPGITWIAAAVLFMLIVCCLVVVVSTVAGIATVDLFKFGKSGLMPVIPEGNTQDSEPVR
jgi:hypothetical protein